MEWENIVEGLQWGLLILPTLITGGMAIYQKIKKGQYLEALTHLVDSAGYLIANNKTAPKKVRKELEKLQKEAGVHDVIAPIVEATKTSRLESDNFKLNVDIDKNGKIKPGVEFKLDF